MKIDFEPDVEELPRIDFEPDEPDTPQAELAPTTPRPASVESHPAAEFGATLSQNVASQAAGGLRMTNAAAEDLARGSGVLQGKPADPAYAAEYAKLTTDLADLEDIDARTREGGSWTPNPEIARIRSRLLKLEAAPENGALINAAEFAQDVAENSRSAYGLPEQKSDAVGSQIARGVANVTALAPAMGAGGLGLPLAAFQGASHAYQEAYSAAEKKAMADGESDPIAIRDKAESAASAAAVKTAPALAAYLAGGKLASAAVTKLLPAAAPAVKGVVGAIAATGANVGTSQTLRTLEGDTTGPTIEGLTQDALFGVIHGAGEYSGARAEVEAKQRQEAAIHATAAQLEEAHMPVTAEVLRNLKPESNTGQPPAAELPIERTALNVDPSHETSAPLEEPQLEQGTINAPAYSFEIPKRAEEAGDVMVNINVPAFDERFAQDVGFYIPRGGGGAEIPGRRAGFEYFLANGLYDPPSGGYRPAPIETPEVYVDERGRVAFDNGRHRYSVLRDRGETSMPVSMSPESAENARRAGLLDESPSETRMKSEPAIEAPRIDFEPDPEPVAQAPEAESPASTAEALPPPPAEPPVRPIAGEPSSPSPEQSPTSIKNAVVDQERAKRGLPPAMEPARRELGTAWDDAVKAIDADSDAPRNLVDELSRKPRPISDTENAILLHRQITLQTEYDAANRATVEASDAGNAAMAEEHRLRAAFLSDELQKVYDVDKKAGTENARGLNARKTMANSDYTLAAMVTRKRAANGGKRLSPEAQAEVERQHAEMQAAQKAAEAATAKADEAAARDAASEAMKRTVAKVKPTRSKPPKAPSEVSSPSARTVGWLEKQAQAARERISARRKKTFADPLGVLTAIDLADRAIVGAADIASGLRDFAGWASRQISQWGEAIKPHLQDLWDRSNALLAQHNSVATIADQMAERVKAGATLGDLRPYVQRMAEGVVRSGVTELEPMLDELHPIVEDVVPGTTRRQVMDLFSGYGQFRRLSKDQIDIQLRELRGEAQQIGKIEDMMGGSAPKKTGMERRTPSDKERALIKEVNRLKKVGGYEVRNPEEQLRSALQAQERALSNSIRDIATKIDTGERRQPTGVSPTNDRIEMLKSLLARLRQTREDVFGSRVKDLTDEQRLKLAIDAANRTAEEYERQIREEDFSRKKGKPTLTSPELEAAKARRDAAKAERDELKELSDAIEGRNAERRETQLTDQIAEIDRKLREGDLSTASTPRAEEPSGNAEFLKAQRDAMQKELDRQRRAADPRRAPSEVEKRRVEALQKDIAELDRKLRTGDLATKPKTATNDSNAVEALKAEREALQKELARQRREANRPALTDAEKEAAAQKRALAAYKKRTAQKIAELTAKTAAGDFSPAPPRRKLQLDAAALKAQADLERAKQEFQIGLIKDRLAKRDWWERGLEGAAKWRRAFVLSGIHTIGKLASAATEIIAFAPIEEAAGGAIGLLPGARQVASKAPRHGGFSVAAEAEAIAANVTKLFSDIGDYMKKGGTDLDAVYGEPHLYPFEWKEMIGRMHGALKTPARRNEWTRSFRKRMEFAARQGVDITDPLVQMKIGVDAYKDAYKSIFMEDNMVVDAYKRAISRFAQVDKATGKPTIAGKSAETAAKILIPVVRIPTNIVARTFEYALGTVSGSYRLAKALRGGIDNLPPEQADLIMQNLKRGSLGAAVLLIGFFNPQNVGGYYHGQRDKKDVKEGELRIFGHNIPKFLIHNPLLEQLQLGATIRRVMDSKLRKNDKETQGLGPGVWAAFCGLVGEIPFLSGLGRVVRGLTLEGRVDFLGELAKTVVPQGLQEMAKWSDVDERSGETTKRSPRTPLEHVESVVPGLRQNVPKKKESRR